MAIVIQAGGRGIFYQQVIGYGARIDSLSLYYGALRLSFEEIVCGSSRSIGSILARNLLIEELGRSRAPYFLKCAIGPALVGFRFPSLSGIDAAENVSQERASLPVLAHLHEDIAGAGNSNIQKASTFLYLGIHVISIVADA